MKKQSNPPPPLGVRPPAPPAPPLPRQQPERRLSEEQPPVPREIFIAILEALEGLVSACSDDMAWSCDDGMNAVQKAEEAIRKAKGEL